MSSDEHKANSDIELWRQDNEDFYSPSIHVTKDGMIDIQVGGEVICMGIENWSTAGRNFLGVDK